MKGGLTEKQVRALHAVAHPYGILGTMFWQEARLSWQGPRQTLGSLERRGLVAYKEDGSANHWSITNAGLEALHASIGDVIALEAQNESA